MRRTSMLAAVQIPGVVRKLLVIPDNEVCSEQTGKIRQWLREPAQVRG